MIYVQIMPLHPAEIHAAFLEHCRFLFWWDKHVRSLWIYSEPDKTYNKTLCSNLLNQELVRLLQQTLRTSQCDRQPVHRPAPAPDSSAASDQTQGLPVPQEEITQLEAQLKERDGQIQSLCGHMERLALEKDSLQQELKGLKIKVGEINDQLGMLMETIQAKDEVIIKLSQPSSQQSSQQSGCLNDAGSPVPSRDQQELDILKVQNETTKPDT